MIRFVARRRARIATVAAVVVVLSACGIPSEGLPRDIPDDRQESLTEIGSGGQATPIGGRRIFLVQSDGTGSVLRSVPRDVGASPSEVMNALLQGPTLGEQAQRLSTALPPGTTVNDVAFVAEATLRVDLSSEIFDATGDTLIDAVAQIVYTMNEVDGVDRVELRVDGQDQQWPRADGTIADAALSIYDYPNRAASSEPDFPAVPNPAE